MNDQIPMTKESFNFGQASNPRLRRCWSFIGHSLVILVWSFGFFLTGCSRPPTAPPTTAASATIASLVPAATDLILGMGAGQHLVAISNWDPKLPELDGLPRVGDYRTVDWEKIAQIHPTHMIVQFAPDKMPAGMADKAASLNIKLVNIRIYRLDDIYKAIDQLGDALNEQTKAAAAKQQLKGSFDATAGHVAGKPRVRTLLVDSENDLATVGGGNYLDDLLSLAGGQNVMAGGENSFPTIDREKLLVLNPDVVIVLLPAASQQVIDQAKQFWAALPQVSAVGNKKVYVLTDSYLLLPGMNVAKIAAQFAALLHPDVSTIAPEQPRSCADAKGSGSLAPVHRGEGWREGSEPLSCKLRYLTMQRNSPLSPALSPDYREEGERISPLISASPRLCGRISPVCLSSTRGAS